MMHYSKNKLFIFASLILMLPHVAFAQGSLDQTISETFNTSTGWFVNLIFAPLPGTSFPWIVVWLVAAALIFSLYFKGIQFRFIGHAIRLVKGDFSNPNDAGEVSHFQALTTALSGTVGLGNIAGVAVAVGIGGPGATFWMIMAGLMGMATKFVECTLAVKYRNENVDGSVSGGPMYYISKGFKEKNIPFGKILAALFAVFCVIASLASGNMFQSNQTHLQLTTVFGDFPGWITGAVMALVVFSVIVGGIKSIASVTEKVVPFMALIYLVACMTILIIHADKIGWAASQIIEGAFTGLGVAGGFVGALIQGFKRAAFSNEAGVGSAAIAHSAVQTSEPITEGFVSLLEPFIDTVVICTMTALVIIITGQLVFDPLQGVYTLSSTGHIETLNNHQGVALTSAAFESTISWFPFMLCIAVVLFAFSTMLSWSYYGLKAWTYLVGEGYWSAVIYKVIFCSFTFIGAVMSLGPVIDFSDAALFTMAVINIISLIILMPIVKKELVIYTEKLKKQER
jgi:AGCS family alanine or glycine:cation symporter